MKSAVASLNINDFFLSQDSIKKQLIDQTNESLTTSGFIQIRDDSIDIELLEKIHAASNMFFQLSIAEKNKVRKPANGAPRGYSNFESEYLAGSLGQNLSKDLNESFQIGPLRNLNSDLKSLDDLQYADNIWPNNPENFESLWKKYYLEMENLSLKIFKLFSIILDIHEDYFLKKSSLHTARLRARYYPQLINHADEQQFRASAHTDYGTFSIILPQKKSSGLEYFCRLQNKWKNIQPLENHFIVNLGDLLTIVTNEYWKAPLHRVVAPAIDSNENICRLSLIYFHSFDSNAVVDPHEIYIQKSGYKKYNSIRTADYIIQKLKLAERK